MFEALLHLNGIRELPHEPEVAEGEGGPPSPNEISRVKAEDNEADEDDTRARRRASSGTVVSDRHDSQVSLSISSLWRQTSCNAIFQRLRNEIRRLRAENARLRRGTNPEVVDLTCDD